MSGFFYWLPDVAPSIKLPELERMGLGYALEDKHTARGCTGGPDGAHGSVVCHGGNEGGLLGYWPGRQTWRQIPGQTAWCGYYTDDPPRPEQLAREDQIAGQWVKCDNGTLWHCPTARKLYEENGEIVFGYNVPRSLTLDESGSWVPGDVKPRYKRLWDDAVRVWEAYCSQSDMPDLDEVSMRCLQTNYRVSGIEMAMLGIYDEQLRVQIPRVLIDAEVVERWLQKKTMTDTIDAGSSSNGGGEESYQDTLPHLPISGR